MALSARADWKESPGHLVEMQVAPGVTIYDGALVGIESGSGAASKSLVTKWSDSEDLIFFGLARVTPTSSGDTGDSITGTTVTTITSAELLSTIGVDVSGVTLHGVTLGAVLTTMDQVGELVYGTDDNVITPTFSASPAIGWVSKIHSTSKVDVKLFTPGEARAVPVA